MTKQLNKVGTVEEEIVRLKHFINHSDQTQIINDVADLIARVRADEREKCAAYLNSRLMASAAMSLRLEMEGAK